MARRDALAAIQADCESDAHSLDDKGTDPGVVVAHLLAMVHTLCAVVASLIPEDRPIEEVAIDYAKREPL